jgi:hypothetical protein
MSPESIVRHCFTGKIELSTEAEYIYRSQWNAKLTRPIPEKVEVFKGKTAYRYFSLQHALLCTIAYTLQAVKYAGCTDVPSPGGEGGK